MYPIAIGSQHMRSQIVLPPNVKAFPEYLRAAGYWTTNRSKTDYNFPPPKAVWNENSAQSRDWRGRASGQPFFSVINLTTTHESQIRGKFGETLHDPAKAQLPPYIPDTPVTRRDWARYADLLTTLDQQVAAILDQLEADGLANDTIVFFWGDHGQGLSRGKRWLYDSGTRVPLIVRWPGALKPGSVCDDLVCFLDFAPTMLRLAGVDLPSHLHGRVLPPIENGITAVGDRPSAIGREFIFGHRDRMDETYDLIRSARDTRFKYLRNYAPRRTYAQNITYMNQMPTMKEWRRLNAEGKLTGAAALHFRETKPVEELFDTEADPHEVVNLVDRPEHAETLKRMRAALERWQEDVGDSGLTPEPLLVTPLKLAER
jgi:N-sulfoglucosamine sulfohydrolase